MEGVPRLISRLRDRARLWEEGGRLLPAAGQGCRTRSLWRARWEGRGATNCLNPSHDQVIVVVVDLMHHAGDLVVNVLQHHLHFVILHDACHDVADHADEHVEHGEQPIIIYARKRKYSVQPMLST